MDLQEKCNQLETELAAAKSTVAQLESEYAEFEKDSKELEEHLESEVARLEQELKASKSQLNALKSELKDIKNEHVKSDIQFQSELQRLENELQVEKQKNTTLSTRLVNLEQENEDLQRIQREVQADLSKSHSVADEALEKNAVLQTDFEELKELSQVTIQRLTDELRELISERDHLERKAANVLPQTPSKLPSQTPDSPLQSPLLSKIDIGTPRSSANTPMEKRRDLLETLNKIAGIARELETRLNPK